MSVFNFFVLVCFCSFYFNKLETRQDIYFEQRSAPLLKVRWPSHTTFRQGFVHDGRLLYPACAASSQFYSCFPEVMLTGMMWLRRRRIKVQRMKKLATMWYRRKSVMQQCVVCHSFLLYTWRILIVLSFDFACNHYLTFFKDTLRSTMSTTLSEEGAVTLGAVHKI